MKVESSMHAAGNLQHGLIWGMSAQVSDEAERSLLVKLKTECGYQFTSKLESMFTDIKTSRDTMQDYKASRRAASSSADDADIDLFVQARSFFLHMAQ